MQTDLKKDPAVLALTPALERLREYATGLVISTAESFSIAGSFLKAIKGSLATIEDSRTKYTKPLNAVIKDLNDDARSASAPWLEMEGALKRAMLKYSDEQDRLQREEQRRANEAAAAEQRRQQEIADRARAKGQDAKADKHEERAQSIVAPVIQREPPKVAGVSIPVVWTFEITDESLIPREYLVIDESKIRKVVIALKGGTNIPGVRAYSQKRIAAGVA